MIQAKSSDSMAAKLLDGKLVSQEIQAETKIAVAQWVASGNSAPTLAAVLVGDDPASHVYVGNKERACKRVGINSQLHRLPSDLSTATLISLIQQLNEDPHVHGILVQLPLPPQIDSQAVLDSVDPRKDVDAFHPHNVGLISQGRPQFLPCTPHGIVQLLKRYGLPVSGKHVCIIGRSDIVGKPMASMLVQKDFGLGPEMANATVTICHSRTQDLKSIAANADVVIAAIGQPNFVTAEMIKSKAVVIDVGINRTDAGLVGDVDFESVQNVAGYITPVPGGVGPLTVTMLLENTLAAARMLATFTLLLACLLITGCQGCRDDGGDEKQQTKEEQEKEKKKPDFVTRSPVLLPGWFPKENSQKDDAEKSDIAAALAEMNNPALRYNRAKLGHWVEAQLPAIANNFNADGQLTSYSTTPAGRPVPIPSTDYFLTTTRPASLAKGEWKNLETSLFLPRRDQNTTFVTANYSFDRGTGGIPYISLGQPTTLMLPYQYHIVLLSQRPDTFNFLKLTDSVQVRGQRLPNDDIAPPYYCIVPSVFGDPIPLPRQPLNWTTIAYLVWDDYDPDSLSRDHQVALLDWLHFGGQLILSGPDCLDKLQNSFLGSYLPAQFDGSRNISNADLVELNEHWTVPFPGRQAEKKILQLSETVPLLGVKFKPHAAAQYVAGMGELAIERAVGRGRIVATGFSLSAPVIRKWRSFPSFVNNVMLRRPSRRFKNTAALDVSFQWENDATSIFDPLVGSTLRYIARDLSFGGTPTEPKFLASDDSAEESPYYFEEPASKRKNPLMDTSSANMLRRNPSDEWHFGGFTDSPSSGVGGWNDDSGIAIAAREALKEAAGITPPSSMFVLKMLAAYLAVLVPLNWLVFRLLGRVEWAWIAAPFIAIFGALLVVKMASLDIGFVRSNTQIGLLEIYANYPRAHATEYSALYTSLSTRYNVDLDNPSAQSLPFAVVNESQFAAPKQSLSQVKIKRSVESRLEGFQIQSNSTGMLHSEFMLDLEGTLYATLDDAGIPSVINNGSVLNLQHTGILRRTDDGKFECAWIGDLAAGSASQDLQFESVTAEALGNRWRSNSLFVSSLRAADAIWDQFVGTDKTTTELSELSRIPELAQNWNNYHALFTLALNNNAAIEDSSLISRNDFRRVYGSVQNNSNIKIGRLFDTVIECLQLSPGEVRLLASTDQRLGRTNFDPAATQTDQQTLVVVHLKRPALPPAKRDANSMTDFTGKSDLDWERENEETDALFEN